MEESSDLASLAYEAFLKKPNKKSNYRYAIIDAIRSDGWGTKNGIQRDVLRNAKTINKEIQDPKDPVLFVDIPRVLRGLSKMDRAIFMLKHYWGFSNSEIGNCFAFSAMWVSTKLLEIHERIRSMVD